MVILSTSGMRGLVGDDLDPKFILKLVDRFLRIVQSKDCVVGYDSRSSSIMLSDLILAKLLYEKCQINDLGITTTPALSHYLRDKNIMWGMMITASHNPPNWNGIKFFMRNGRGPTDVEIKKLRVKMSYSLSQKKKVDSGSYGYLSNNSKLLYGSSVVSYVGRNSCKGLHVALDVGGGSGYSLAPEVFSKLGCKVSIVNGDPGKFRRDLDPTNDDLSELRKTVIEKGCDVGFAYDCDGDRVVIVNNKGMKLSSDATLFMVVNYLANVGTINKVAVSVDTTTAIENMMSFLGGSIIYSKVGEANVVHELLKYKCQLGGEGSSAGVIIPENSYCRDGILTSAILTKALTKHSFHELVAGLSDYHQVRRKILWDLKELPRLVEYISEKGGNINLLDGIRIGFDNNSWVLIRPSGTEQVLRISVEASSQGEADSLMLRYVNLLKNWNS